MTIEQKLKEFKKTARFKELVAEKMKTDPNLGSSSKGHSAKDIAMNFGNHMREILQNEIVSIKSSVTDESFLDHIIISEEFISGTGWVVNISFDDKYMHRESLYPEAYPDGVELDEIFNEGYPKIRADIWGKWHGEYTYGLDHRKALYFIQRSVEKFNSKYKGKAVAQYSSRYTGGTL